MQLFEMVCEMAACNEVTAKPQSQWPDVKPFDIDALNYQAERIPEELVSTFVDGDYDDNKIIACQHDAMQLHVFLDFVFNDDIQILNFELPPF